MEEIKIHIKNIPEIIAILEDIKISIIGYHNNKICYFLAARGNKSRNKSVYRDLIKIRILINFVVDDLDEYLVKRELKHKGSLYLCHLDIDYPRIALLDSIINQLKKQLK